MMEHIDITQALTKVPEWESLTAYERTLHCCNELALRGMKIPSCAAIRKIIGKGSIKDILDAVNKYYDGNNQSTAKNNRKSVGNTNSKKDPTAVAEKIISIRCRKEKILHYKGIAKRKKMTLSKFALYAMDKVALLDPE